MRKGFDVVVRAEVQAEDDVILLAFRREHHDRHFQVLLTDGAAKLKAVDAGQHDVQENQVRVRGQGEMQPRFSFGGGEHFITLGHKRIFETADESGFVLDDQDAAPFHTGTDTRNVLPAPTQLSTRTEPRWARMM